MPHWPHGPRGVPARAVSDAVHVYELQHSALRLMAAQPAEFWGRPAPAGLHHTYGHTPYTGSPS
jgi:hypothetical protein